MRNIENFIEEYLSQKTEYAIQVVGDWGTGKTHYYRNTLEERIKNTPVFNDQTKKYKPIYISLFGLKSVEDIATKVVLEFYQSKLFKGYFKGWRRRKQLKVTASIFKIGLRGFLNFQKWGNANDYLTDVQEIGKNALNEYEILICFDDLERKDSDLSLNDLIGYINSLVDAGVKVLTLTNEDILKKDSNENYKDLKEKVIDISIPFHIPTETIIKSIIKERYLNAGFNAYGEFLNSNMGSLVKIASSTKNNYRHLIYALKSYQSCYSLFKIEILSNNHEIKEVFELNINRITFTYLAFLVEYKSSNITYKDKSKFSNQFIALSGMENEKLSVYNNKSSIPIEDDETKKEVTFESFRSKYGLKTEDYKFFKTIFSYVTNYNDFNIDGFIEEFKQTYRLGGGGVLPEYKIMNSLSYGDCFELSDEEYEEKTNQLIEFAEQGKYLPSEYLTVVYYSERFDNPIGLDFHVVLDRLKTGLIISIKKVPLKNGHEYSRFGMSKSTAMSDLNKKIHDYGIAQIKQEKEERAKTEQLTISKSLLDNPKEFLQRYTQVAEFKYKVDSEFIFSSINEIDMLNCLESSSKTVLDDFKFFFEERYKKEEVRNNETEQMRRLNSLLNKYRLELDDTGQKIKQHLISELISVFDRYFPSSEEE